MWDLSVSVFFLLYSLSSLRGLVKMFMLADIGFCAFFLMLLYIDFHLGGFFVWKKLNFDAFPELKMLQF